MQPERNVFLLLSGLIILLLVGCDETPSLQNQRKSIVPDSINFQPSTTDRTRLVHSQTVYVPIYSSISRRVEAMDHLSAILSIRNVSLENEIVISQVDYYDTNGKLLRKFIEQSFTLGKMSSKDFLIPQDDLSGGVGANFIVKWETEKQVPSPIIESIMIGSMGPQGFSFTSRGKEIEVSF